MLLKGTPASEGVSGLAGSYELDANGWEADQLYAKMLIGALCLEQVNYDYLTKMDVDYRFLMCTLKENTTLTKHTDMFTD